jgi:hypothetical protein
MTLVSLAGAVVRGGSEKAASAARRAALIGGSEGIRFSDPVREPPFEEVDTGLR